MANNLLVTPHPHIKSPMTTQKIMLNVIIALVPAIIASVIMFGFRSLLIIAISAASCVLFEYLFNLATKREQTVFDLSAVVTGILLACNLPVGIPMWMVIIGAFTAIIVGKCLFGGLGQNFVNPAILGRIVLMISFTTEMTTWATPFDWYYGISNTTATPLTMADAIMSKTKPSDLELFLGMHAGCLGEVSALALLIGGIYLVCRRIINPIIPVTYIGTVFVFTAILGKDPVYHVLAGGLMLGAIFMATDYVTSPVTNLGKVIFGLGLGVITVIIRLFGSYPEGVSFAIILMNILVPFIDKATKTRPFGRIKPQKKAKKGGAEA